MHTQSMPSLPVKGPFRGARVSACGALGTGVPSRGLAPRACPCRPRAVKRPSWGVGLHGGALQHSGVPLNAYSPI
eukprot:7175383-Alexandrium_andersonii.AAC.1